MEKEIGTFRKSTFGGFNRKDVINYIEKMKNETYEYKMQVEQTVRTLNEKIVELENAASLCTEGSASSVRTSAFGAESVGDIKDATSHLKSVADELCKSLSDLIEKLSVRGLYEEGEEISSFDMEPFAEEEEETETDTVTTILSALSFLDEEKNDKKVKERSDDKTDKPTTDVGEILSVLSFLK